MAKTIPGGAVPTSCERLVDEEGIILVAVERKITDEQGKIKEEVTVNPGPDFVLKNGDNMFVIAKEEPKIQ